ncbi:MAG: hypothetical protein AAF511_07150 [Pseudomonadota bacterium]
MRNGNTGIAAEKPDFALRWLAVLAAASPFVSTDPAPFDILAFLVILALGARLLQPGNKTINAFSLVHIFFVAIAVSVFVMRGASLGGFQLKYLVTQIYLTFLFAVLHAVFSKSRQSLIVFAGFWTAAAIVQSVVVILLDQIGGFPIIYRDEAAYRLRGFFQDPNVLGPFLVFPMAYLVSAARVPFVQRLVGIGILALLLLLTYSRAAWGGALVAMMIAIPMSGLLLAPRRALGLATVGVGVMVMAVIGAVIADGGSALQDRLQFQDYDTGRLEHLVLALLEGWTNPFGLGPGAFLIDHETSPHNLFLGRLTDAGYVPTLLTIAVFIFAIGQSFRVALRERSGLAVAVFAALMAHLVISGVINSHHWRHLIVLLAMGIALGSPFAKPAPETRKRQQAPTMPRWRMREVAMATDTQARDPKPRSFREINPYRNQWANSTPNLPTGR